MKYKDFILVEATYACVPSSRKTFTISEVSGNACWIYYQCAAWWPLYFAVLLESCAT